MKEPYSPTDHLLYQREIGNPHDIHFIAIKGNITGVDGMTTVGYVLKKISVICAILIRCGGTIKCVVNNARRLSADLPQGGLKILCINFTVKTQSEAAKTERLLKSAQNVANTRISEEMPMVSSSQLPCSDAKNNAAMVAVNDVILKSEPSPCKC